MDNTAFTRSNTGVVGSNPTPSMDVCTYIQASTDYLFNYTTCFDPNGSSSDVFSYTSFTIELQREIHTFLLTYIGHKRLRSFSFTPYCGI
jgi:hypothetical protein